MLVLFGWLEHVAPIFCWSNACNCVILYCLLMFVKSLHVYNEWVKMSNEPFLVAGLPQGCFRLVKFGAFLPGKPHVQAVFAEFVGTTLLITIGCGPLDPRNSGKLGI